MKSSNQNLKKLKSKVIFFVVTLLFFTLFPPVALAKDYSIKSADFTVQINKNGSATVTEKRTYDFDGSYSWADEWINTKGYKLKDIKITGVDNFTTEITEDNVYIKWYYKASNETKTFTLNYTILDAVTNHDDISEFYWQLIGDEWEKGVENVTAKVILYEEAKDNQIYGFGHGPLNGVVAILTSNQVNFTASNLPAKKMFEVRVLFPKGMLAGGRAGSSNLESILKEEKSFSEKKQTNKNIILGINIILAIFVLYRIIIWTKRFIKYGKDDKLPEVNLANSLHEPPSELEPILVETMLVGAPTGKSIVATILELVRRKILAIDFIKGGKKTLFGSKDQYFLKILKEKNISKNERLLINYLFEENNDKKLDFEEIKKFGMTRRMETVEFWRNWQKNAKEGLESKGFYETKSLEFQKKAFIEIALSFLLMFATAITLNPIIPIIYMIFTIFMAILMPKKSKWGGEEKAKWLAFKKWLKDYSVTKNYPIDSVILWEKYLVLWISFGSIDKSAIRASN